MITYGRRKIFADCDHIDETNIEKIIGDALEVHKKNAVEIEYLRNYAKGVQPILERGKKIREDIVNKVVVNTASEVIDFKMSYIFAAPIEIVRPANAASDIDITLFQHYMAEQDKDGVDQEIALDLCIGGVAYRGVLNNPRSDEESPFCMVEMLPETTFCIYKNDVFRRKLLGVSYVVCTNGDVIYTAYTPTHRYELRSDASTTPRLVNASANGIGEIPIAEYFMPEGMGVFEKAMSLMNAYNTATSNRIDDIEQFVQSILAIFGVDLDDKALEQLKTSLCLLVPDVQEGVQPQAKYLNNSMDQTSVQSVVDDVYFHILEICGVPGREQSSGGNTGNATELGAGGWRKAQYAAERLIRAWQKGDREMYRIALSILDRAAKVPAELKKMRVTDLESKFTLSKSNNLLSKTQALTTMIQCGIAPRIAIREVDLFADAEATYMESKPYLDKALERMSGATKQSDGEASNDEKRRGDVTNQPKSEQSLTQAAEGRGNVQKQD